MTKKAFVVGDRIYTPLSLELGAACNTVSATKSHRVVKPTPKHTRVPMVSGYKNTVNRLLQSGYSAEDVRTYLHTNIPTYGMDTDQDIKYDCTVCFDTPDPELNITNIKGINNDLLEQDY